LMSSQSLFSCAKVMDGSNRNKKSHTFFMFFPFVLKLDEAILTQKNG